MTTRTGRMIRTGRHCVVFEKHDNGVTEVTTKGRQVMLIQPHHAGWEVVHVTDPKRHGWMERRVMSSINAITHLALAAAVDGVSA